MGVYANNTYNLTIPMTEVGKITAEYREAVRGGWYELPSEWDADTPESLVAMVAHTCGCDDNLPETLIDGTDLRIIAGSFGKASDTSVLFGTLAKHGATGTIESEVENEFWLAEFTGTEFFEHKGVVTYPTFKEAK